MHLAIQLSSPEIGPAPYFSAGRRPSPPAGNLVIDANQAGGTNYSAAPQVQRTITVTCRRAGLQPSLQLLPPTPLSLRGSAMYPITVTDVGSSFTSTVMLNVSGLPPGGTFNPTTPGIGERNLDADGDNSLLFFNFG